MNNWKKNGRWLEYFKGTKGYEIDGTWLPRVTAIVEIKAKPGLERYLAESKGYKDVQSTKRQAADEGSHIHEIAEAVLLGKSIPVPPAIAPAIFAVRRFLKEHALEITEENVEKRIHHPTHRYAGTIDVLATLDGKRGILDIKTGAAVYRDYRMQTAAYFDAVNATHPEALETRWIFRIDQFQRCSKCGAKFRVKGGRESTKGGTDHGAHEWGPIEGEVELVEFHDDFEHDLAGFLHAKGLWEWEHRETLREIGYL
ncbi:hypothetical protein HYW30_01230 [Candidatus Azambacteria bacterium]|nr:hypothetical protein [Candidatus Azambacteria bacterium]MBI2587910.1 hypothetical protein [Candidatus Azambacteria bacterium]